MNCAICDHEKIEHEEDVHHGMAIEIVPGCLGCIMEIQEGDPKGYEFAFHEWVAVHD